jgi:hypothetical protein
MSCPHADVWRLAPAGSRGAFRRFIRQSIPLHDRAALWRLWTSPETAAQAAEAATFRFLAAQGESGLRPADAALLRADLPRTPRAEGVSVDSLRRVLCAFVSRCDLDSGGYTQGEGGGSAGGRRAHAPPHCPSRPVRSCPYGCLPVPVH